MLGPMQELSFFAFENVCVGRGERVGNDSPLNCLGPNGPGLGPGAVLGG